MIDQDESPQDQIILHPDINDDGLIIKDYKNAEVYHGTNGISFISREDWKLMVYLTFKCAFALFAIMISFFSNSLVSALLTSRIFLEAIALLLKQLFNPETNPVSDKK